MVAFLHSNVKKHPGSTELLIQVQDVETQMITKLKSHHMKIEVNDELIQFLQDNDVVNYRLEVT